MYVSLQILLHCVCAMACKIRTMFKYSKNILDIIYRLIVLEDYEKGVYSGPFWNIKKMSTQVLSGKVLLWPGLHQPVMMDPSQSMMPL